MKEQIISFETAKLAKEKGLISGLTVYHAYCIGWQRLKADKEPLAELKRDSVKGQFHLALAPTQSLLQKWLREVHHIHIMIAKSEDGWICQLQQSFQQEAYLPKFDNYLILSSYEEALEEGLKEALKLITV